MKKTLIRLVCMGLAKGNTTAEVEEICLPYPRKRIPDGHVFTRGSHVFTRVHTWFTNICEKNVPF